MESESDLDDAIISNEEQIISIEEMFVNTFCCEESILFQQTTQTDSKLKSAVKV